MNKHDRHKPSVSRRHLNSIGAKSREEKGIARPQTPKRLLVLSGAAWRVLSRCATFPALNSISGTEDARAQNAPCTVRGPAEVLVTTPKESAPQPGARPFPR